MGLFEKVELSKEISLEKEAREKIEIKIMEYSIYNMTQNDKMTLEGFKEYFQNDEEIEYIELYYEETASLTDGLEKDGIGNAKYGKIKLKDYKYIYTLDQYLNIVEINDILIDEYYPNNKSEEDDDKDEDLDTGPTIEDGLGDTNKIPAEIIKPIEAEEYDPTVNIFGYNKGARVTYVSSVYNVSANSINNGYTGENGPIGNETDSFWKANNSWNVQGSLENDNSIDNIKYNHEENTKNEASATTMEGNSEIKQIMIIDPRAYYGDTQLYTYEIDELYMASANSDGDVGNYSIYISNGSTDVATNPDDSSWEFVTSGTITEDAKLINVYSEKLEFKYIKLELYARQDSYMELAAIKGFKKYGEDNEISIAAKKENNKINILAIAEISGIEKIVVENPDGLIASKTSNYYKSLKMEYIITANGTYRIYAINKNGKKSKEIQFLITDIEEKTEYNYTGNLFNYNQGARVTYVNNIYGATGKSVNNGYTGYNGAVGNVTDSFWLATNGWNVQGCVENNDSKTNMEYNHNGETKNVKSATTMLGGNTVKQVIIITPRAYQGDTLDYLFNLKEIYMGSANSDGDVGKYEIYLSSIDEDISTDPDNSTWHLLTSGELEKDGELTNVYSGNAKFRYIKLVTYARQKGYMELAALKIFK